MNTEVLRIIEGGLTNDQRKIISYANRLADRLDKEGESPLAKCIRQKLNTSMPHSAIVADALMSSITKANSNLTFEENHKMASMRYDLETHDNIMNLLIRDDVNEYVKQKINAKKGQKENIDTIFVDAQATRLSGYKNPWVMIDANTGEVIDDGNGYGFKSEENAIKHYTYTRGNKY